MSSSAVASTIALLEYYSFDSGGQSLRQVVDDWISDYPAKWVISAVIESIYQGRYKIQSVNKILLRWQHDGKPQHHFDVEFADLICGKILKQVRSQSLATVDLPKKVTNQPEVKSTTSRQVLVEDSLSRETISRETIAEPYDEAVSPSERRTSNQGIKRWLKLITKL